MRCRTANVAYQALVAAVALLFIGTIVVAILMPGDRPGPFAGAWLSHYLCLPVLLGCWRLAFHRPDLRMRLCWLGRLLARLRQVPDGIWVGIAAMLYFAVSYYLSGAIFHHVPTETDSMSQYAGAKIFAHGMWVAPSHPLPRFFDTVFFFNQGTFYTFYPPGHMFLLALGHLAGNPAAVNPLLGSLSLIATYYLTREIGGRRAARISLFLFLLSPFMFFISGEFDNRSTALLCVTLFALFYIRAVKTNRSLYALLSGLALGYLCITRPQTALPYALPFALYALRLLWEDWRRYTRLFIVMGMAVVPFIGFFLFYNWQTNGDAFLTGYQKYWGAEVVPGSGITTREFWHHTLPLQTGWAVVYLQLLDRQFFCWPIGSLIAAVSLWVCKAQKPFCGLLAAVFLSMVLSLTLTPYVSIIFGPRYLFEVSSIVILFTAIFIARFPAILRANSILRISSVQWLGLWVFTVVVLSAIGLATTTSDLAYEYSHNYRIGRPAFVHMLDASVKKPALVIVHGRELYYGLAYLQPMADTDAIIYVNDLRDQNKHIMDYYPDRYVYFAANEQEIRLIRGTVTASPAPRAGESTSGTR